MNRSNKTLKKLSKDKLIEIINQLEDEVLELETKLEEYESSDDSYNDYVEDGYEDNEDHWWMYS